MAWIIHICTPFGQFYVDISLERLKVTFSINRCPFTLTITTLILFNFRDSIFWGRRHNITWLKIAFTKPQCIITSVTCHSIKYSFDFQTPSYWTHPITHKFYTTILSHKFYCPDHKIYHPFKTFLQELYMFVESPLSSFYHGKRVKTSQQSRPIVCYNLNSIV